MRWNGRECYYVLFWFVKWGWNGNSITFLYYQISHPQIMIEWDGLETLITTKITKLFFYLHLVVVGRKIVLHNFIGML